MWSLAKKKKNSFNYNIKINKKKKVSILKSIVKHVPTHKLRVLRMFLYSQ